MLYINLAITVVVWLLYLVLLYQTMHSVVSFVKRMYCYSSVSLSVDGYLGFTITISLHWQPEGRDEPDVQTTQQESDEDEEGQDNPFARAKSKLKTAEVRTPPDKMNLYKELDRLKKKKPVAGSGQNQADLQLQLQNFLEVSHSLWVPSWNTVSCITVVMAAITTMMSVTCVCARVKTVPISEAHNRELTCFVT